jgi:hypothetical protein
MKEMERMAEGRGENDEDADVVRGVRSERREGEDSSDRR